MDSIRNNKQQLVDGLEGRRSLELISAIYESIETGKLTIKVEDKGDASIGDGVIEKDETSITISQDNIDENSKIFITPRVMTEKPLVVTEIEDGEFTVEVSDPIEDEEGLLFDWWIVDVE